MKISPIVTRAEHTCTRWPQTLWCFLLSRRGRSFGQSAFRSSPCSNPRSFLSPCGAIKSIRIVILWVSLSGGFYFLLVWFSFHFGFSPHLLHTMKIICSASLFAAFLSSTEGFAPTTRSTTTTTNMGRLNAMSSDRIKKAGGGIPLEPAGNKHLFDPATDGKLQGTGSCDARISSAFEFEYLAPMAPPVVPEALDDAQHWLEDIGTPPPVFAKATKPATARVLGRARTYLSSCVYCCASIVKANVTHPCVDLSLSNSNSDKTNRFDCTWCTWWYSTHLIAASQGDAVYWRAIHLGDSSWN